jgi:pimeloyl-ACP methyl ester carboxylesterase
MLVILHGWSDEAKRFNKLATHIAGAGISAPIQHIRLGDYVTMDDHVTFDDLAEAMDRAWSAEVRPHEPVDLIAHSTGALVTRHWLRRKRSGPAWPIRRFVQLAPANFGSPLAHTGRTVLGRVGKGWALNKPFETGTELLHGLEIGSDFTLELAKADRLSGPSPFQKDRILSTVLVGNTGYSGIPSLANRHGGDGTVYVSTADLNPVLFEVDFTKTPDERPRVSEVRVDPSERVAFGVLDAVNHDDITLNHRKPDAAVLDRISRALTVTPDTYDAWVRELDERNRSLRDTYRQPPADVDQYEEHLHRHGYQNTVFRVVDDLGHPVQDYAIDLFVNEDQSKRDREKTKLIQERVIRKVHVNRRDASTRAFMIDCDELAKLLTDSRTRLCLSVTASPDFNTRKSVGYKTHTSRDIGTFDMTSATYDTYFQANRTAYFTLVIKRHIADAVFAIKRV